MLFLVAASLAVSGCEEQIDEATAKSQRAAHSRLVTPRRAIEPKAPRSTAGLPRAQIAGETRSVLGTLPRLLVRWQDPIVLAARGGVLEVSGELSDGTAPGTPLLLTARVSVEDPEHVESEADEIGGASAHRRVLRSVPTIVRLPASRRVSVDVLLPDSASLDDLDHPNHPNYEEGLVDLLARPLGDSAQQRWTTRPFDVVAEDRLVFGYGVEEDGWGTGFPAVMFRVEAMPADEGAAEPLVLFERTLDPARDEADRRWHDASVELAPLAGRRVQFDFIARALGPIGESDLSRSFPVVSNPELVAGPLDLLPPVAGIRPSLILISLDTLRARSMSAYGRERMTTPTFDARVAGQGALVVQAVTPFPYTPPSHVSMLTGLDVCAHGIENRHGILAPERVTLAEALRAGGYRTAAFTENGYVVAGAGFARGFDTYHELRSDERAAPGFADETFARAERWLRGVDGRPFFLFIHTYQVHGPYTPPPSYRELFASDGRAHVPAAHRAALDDYEREVRYTDDLLGHLLDVLDEKGLSDRTMLVVTSDHGEQFGEHFFTGHGFDLHDEALLVPMAIRAPGLISPGTIVDVQVGLMDLAPTLLDLLHLPPLRDVQGRSFASLLVADGAGDHAAFEERALVGKASHSRSVRTREYKYIEGTGQGTWSKLYHLRDDPDERSNLASEQPDELVQARLELAEHEAACAGWRAAHPTSATAGDGLQERPGWMIHRDEIERRLRSLGYVE